jgi:YwqJ-like deaminase
MEYFIRSGGQGTDDDLAQIVLKLVCNFDYKKRGKNATASKRTTTKKPPAIAPHFSGFRMLATGVEARLSNNITLMKISGKGHTMIDYFVMQNRKTFSFDYQRKVVGWNYFADARLFLNLTGGHFNQVQVTSSHVASVKVADSDKLIEAIKRSAKYMPGELYEQVKALLTPEAIAGMAAFGAAYVASQLTPVGWIADALVAVMFIGGVIFMGTELIEVGKLLIKFYETATNASSDAQYDEAGKYFAEAVIKVGVDVIVMIIFHKATKAVDRKIIKIKSNSGGGGGNGGGNSETIAPKSEPEPVKPKEIEPAKESEVIKGGKVSKPLMDAVMNEANNARTASNSTRPGAAGGMELENGNILTGTSAKGRSVKLNPEVQAVLDAIPEGERSRGHGKCVEPQIISEALEQGKSVKNATSYVVDVQKPGKPNHGSPKHACASCAKLLKHFGIKDGAK